VCDRCELLDFMLLLAWLCSDSGRGSWSLSLTKPAWESDCVRLVVEFPSSLKRYTLDILGLNSFSLTTESLNLGLNNLSLTTASLNLLVIRLWFLVYRAVG